MGMSASQARLLSLTARMTDNENTGQTLSYAKIRLANQSEQASKEYNEALSATKLIVLTGYDGSTEQYTDISYNVLTGYNKVATGLQYLVTNKDNKVLVTSQMAKAFEAGNGDYNVFLANLGYSQSTINVKNSTDATNNTDLQYEKNQAYVKIHEAWDKYLTSVGLTINDGDEEHGLDFDYVTFSNKPYDGYVTYSVYDEEGNVTEKDKPLNYEGTTREQRELYDYAVSLTEAYYGKTNSNMLKNNADGTNDGYLLYLRNIFEEMASQGYFTQDDESKTIKDNTWFEEQLRQGELQLKYYSAVDKGFVSTSIDSDSNIQEVSDERAIALAEQDYEQKVAQIEALDNKYDLELKKIDTEHNALQTEYEVMKNIIDKNIEKSFNCFS